MKQYLSLEKNQGFDDPIMQYLIKIRLITLQNSYEKLHCNIIIGFDLRTFMFFIIHYLFCLNSKSLSFL